MKTLNTKFVVAYMCRAYQLKPRKTLALIVLALLCVWDFRVLADVKKVKIGFSVEDPNGRPIPDAQVTIRRKKAGDVTKVTDSDGKLKEDVALDVSENYEYVVTAAGYAQKDDTISSAQLSKGSVELTIRLTKQVSSAVEQKAETANMNSGRENIATPRTTRGESNDNRLIDNRGAPKEVSESWFKPIVDFFQFLFSFWWLALTIAAICVVFVLWFKGYRIKRFHRGFPVPSTRENVQFMVSEIGKMRAEIKDLKVGQGQIPGSQGIQTALEDIQRQLNQLPALISRSQRPDGTRSSQSTGSQQFPSPYALDDRVDHSAGNARSAKESAQIAYEALARNEVISVDPIYLKAEVKSSPMAMLEHDEVYLQEVRNTQGSFVLFPDADRRGGWVFPNPNVSFRPEALRPVFPKLGEWSEPQFQSGKTHIDPVRVNQSGDERWVVE